MPAPDPYLSARQRMPVWSRDRSQRRGNSVGDPVQMLPRRVLGSQAAIIHGDIRDPSFMNDGAIRRDRTPWFPSEAVGGVGTAEVDWTAAGPTRPELNMRNVTLRREAGTDQTRAFANPLDPTVGLHTNPPLRAPGNAARAAAGAPIMRPGRTDRLNPSRYSGQSYSQTTILQGGMPQGRRRVR